jgi:hypothetical protein
MIIHEVRAWRGQRSFWRLPHRSPRRCSAGRSAVDLWVKLNGCQYVANGFIEAAQY